SACARTSARWSAAASLSTCSSGSADLFPGSFEEARELDSDAGRLCPAPADLGVHVEPAPVRQVDGGDQIFRLYGQIDAQERPAGRDVFGGSEQIPRAGPDPRVELHSAPGVLAPPPDGIEILPFHKTILTQPRGTRPLSACEEVTTRCDT